MTSDRPDDNPFDAQNQHWISVRVYYEDTDFTGLVYHANYLKYFERGRSDFLRDAGISHQALLARPDPAAFTILRAELDFRQAARVDDLLHVRTRYHGLSGARILFEQAVMRGDTLIAEGQITALTIHADGRPRRPIPEIAGPLDRLIWVPEKT